MGQDLNIEDLRSAFPRITSLRYRDKDEQEIHHILCRNGVFVSPEGGWNTEGRIYTALCGTDGRSNSRFGIFDSYRRRLSSREGGDASRKTVVDSFQQKGNTKRVVSSTVTLKVGHGHFKAGKFSKISFTSLSGLGGLVTVGPIPKTGNTTNFIKSLACKKFCDQNRSFRRKYKHREDDFLLLYPDGSVINNLPDNSEDFSVEAYRDFIDPQIRYDRLRFYICEKSNYSLHNEVEIISDSSSSSDDLPDLAHPSPGSSSSTLNNNNNQSNSCIGSNSPKYDEDDTLPLVIDVVFHHHDMIFQRSFPNNAQGMALFDYINKTLNKTVMLRFGERYINPEDRLMEISSTPVLQLYTESHESEETDGDQKREEPITSEYLDTAFESCIQKVTDRVIGMVENVEEPTEILRTYSKEFLTGRPLDILENDEDIEGETTALFVSRTTLFDDAVSEILAATNIRTPLEVTFYGEMSQDLGGPRLEFFGCFLAEVVDKLLKEDSLEHSTHLVVKKAYYATGIILGLSALQGGPCAPFLAGIVNNYFNREDYRQLRMGMERVGLWQMLKKKPTLQFLFQPKTSKLTVNKLLHLMPPSFSELGSNKRIAEEKSYSVFIKYVRNVAAGRRGNITLGHILQFVTGSNEEPVLGFSKSPSMRFTELSGGLPTASTCVKELCFPLNLMSQDEDNFDKFDLAFASQYFGLV